MKNEGGKEEKRNCEEGGSRGGHWAIARICDRGIRIRDTVRVGQLPLNLKVAVSQQVGSDEEGIAVSKARL